jgi:hypothetical protein
MRWLLNASQRECVRRDVRHILRLVLLPHLVGERCGPYHAKPYSTGVHPTELRTTLAACNLHLAGVGVLVCISEVASQQQQQTEHLHPVATRTNPIPMSQREALQVLTSVLWELDIFRQQGLRFLSIDA